MRVIIGLFIFILIYSPAVLSFAGPIPSRPDKIYVDASVKRAVDIAEQKRSEAQKKAALLNDYYRKGKNAFRDRKYKKAVSYFEDILDIDPSYEPAKLYLESSLIHLEILREQENIYNIKLKMADTIAEYDRRRENMDSLTVRYFLEQAQLKCQLGDYKGAEEFYKLCYKVYPYSKEQIEWFVKATYDLAKLSQALDKHRRKIEELATFE